VLWGGGGFEGGGGEGGGGDGGGGGGGGVEIPYINDRGVLVTTFRNLKAVLVAVRVLSLKRSTVRALVVPLRALRNF